MKQYWGNSKIIKTPDKLVEKIIIMYLDIQIHVA